MSFKIHNDPNFEITVSGLNLESNNISIGEGAFRQSAPIGAVAIGGLAGRPAQALHAVAIGFGAAASIDPASYQGIASIAIGSAAGSDYQGNNAVSIGHEAGLDHQGLGSISIGASAGRQNQGGSSISLGYFTGQNYQGTEAVAIGAFAGRYNQGTGAVAIGTSAGQQNQGTGAIAIGLNAGATSQSRNSRIISATGDIGSAGEGECKIAPIRTDTGAGLNSLAYDPATYEIIHATSKTFVIQHPIDPNKYLVHGCLEGPEAGVYYRGKENIPSSHKIVISLPNYASHIATNFTTHVTPVCNSYQRRFVGASDVVNGKFTIYGDPGPISWIVHGTRSVIETEPLKESHILLGDGPYTYLS
jgi:hypothetical protein